ncbi:MAG: alpha-ribazole phosphatase family protein [Gammaproteobacteria bacterium]|nr:alpha-ribazole phosphatase family protein [Gammaproteobacteria bacterium]
MIIDLLRHGDVDGETCFRGHTDDPLSKTGWQQMHAAVEKYAADIMVSSPLKRCADFATNWSGNNNIESVFMSEFKEINFGDWDGLSAETIQSNQAAELNSFWNNPVEFTPPNGETLLAFQERILNGWNSLIENQHDKHVLLVTHGGVIKMIISHVLSIPLDKLLSIETPLASMTRIRISFDDNNKQYASLVFHSSMPTGKVE